MYKWLVITVLVISVFFILLLGLGYLLKENEAETKQLIVKLEKEKTNKKQKFFKKNEKQLLTLTVQQKSYQNIIQNHNYCESDSQCFIINIQDEALGCFIVVNTTGAAILLKVAGMREQKISAAACMKRQNSNKAYCKNNKCIIK